jgi:hypothetical protein
MMTTAVPNKRVVTIPLKDGGIAQVPSERTAFKTFHVVYPKQSTDITIWTKMMGDVIKDVFQEQQVPIELIADDTLSVIKESVFQWLVSYCEFLWNARLASATHMQNMRSEKVHLHPIQDDVGGNMDALDVKAALFVLDNKAMLKQHWTYRV